MNPRTSDTHPLQIASVETPGNGRIGMTFCPGKHDPMARTGPWARDSQTDIIAIVNLHPNMTHQLHRKMYRQKRRKYTYSK